MVHEPISVSCQPAGDGWRCAVRVGDDAGATVHEVAVDRDTLRRLAEGAEPDDLVRESFRFLLEREPRGSIMRSFELPIIGRYFAEYETEIERRMRR
ncbi:MAG: hypothetical protein ACRDGJ_07735 [Candidatus Limnocylindria bacterium]